MPLNATRASDRPVESKPVREYAMRFVTFNANGIRARFHQIEAIDQAHRPDVIAVQETKVHDSEFPVQAIQAIGYEHLVIHGQKGHYGVALFSRIPRSMRNAAFPGGRLTSSAVS